MLEVGCIANTHSLKDLWESLTNKVREGGTPTQDLEYQVEDAVQRQHTPWPFRWSSARAGKILYRGAVTWTRDNKLGLMPAGSHGSSSFAMRGSVLAPPANAQQPAS